MSSYLYQINKESVLLKTYSIFMSLKSVIPFSDFTFFSFCFLFFCRRKQVCVEKRTIRFASFEIIPQLLFYRFVKTKQNISEFLNKII